MKEGGQMSRGVPLDQLSDAIVEELQKYSQEASDRLKKGLESVAKEAVQELKQTSPKMTGAYAGSWTATKGYESDDDIRIIVNARSPHYRLTHLLEYGHASPKGGRRVPAKPHIAAVEQKVIDKAMKVVEDAYG